MSEINKKLDDILSEDNEHLTIVEGSKIIKKEEIVKEVKQSDEIEEFYCEDGFTKEKENLKKESLIG